MTKQEQKYVEQQLKRREEVIELAKRQIERQNYGLALETLCKEREAVTIEVDSPESYKPLGKETLNSFIYKGIKWLEDKFSEHDESSGRGDWIEIRSWDFDSMEEMIKDFRKTMEG